MFTADLAILVLGYARPQLLRNVLESLKRQNAIGSAHVWIDGTADRMEIRADVAGCAAIAREYEIADLRTHHGHLGIEKLMLDALAELSENFDKIIVLEDDCFPSRNAVPAFLQCLAEVEQRPDIFSVYGHHFLTPEERDTFSRFQGWGWATTRTKLLPILQEVYRLFALSEAAYLAYTRAHLTPEIVARLNVTPGRNVTEVLARFFSWDSCTALITAKRGLGHMRTPERVVFNCGLGNESGHFADKTHLRLPPFNMIRPDEVWNHF